MLAKVFGFTNEQKRYAYLSDGGHFENLRLYEMVLRRCRDLVVSAAGCDDTMEFQDLGNAIRKSGSIWESISTSNRYNRRPGTAPVAVMRQAPSATAASILAPLTAS